MNLLSKNKNAYILLTLLFYCSCSIIDNRESKAKAKIENKIEKESDGKINLSSFTKTNALESNFMGMNLYEVLFQGTISFKLECYKELQHPNEYSNFYVTSSADYSSSDFKSHYGHFNKGEIVKFSGKVTFQKYESGWEVVDTKVSIPFQ